MVLGRWLAVVIGRVIGYGEGCGMNAKKKLSIINFLKGQKFNQTDEYGQKICENAL